MEGLSQTETDRLVVDINVTPEIITVTVHVKEQYADELVTPEYGKPYYLSREFTESFSAPNRSQRDYNMMDDTEKNIDVAKALRMLAYKLETGEPIEVI